MPAMSKFNALRAPHATAQSPCEGGPVTPEVAVATGRGFTLKQRGHFSGFTLAELLVTVGVLVLLVFLFTQLLNSAATITTLSHKQMDGDSQARQLLDRMAIDFAQLVKRSDVDFFAKGTLAPNSVGGTMTGNDQIAFYSAVPGYYPATGSQSPVSLVAYRVNSDSTSSSYNKLQRMGKGLVWNGVSQTDTPVIFLPLTISNTWCQATISGTPSPSCTGTPDPNYEMIGPQVFRFEYYYLLKNGSFSDIPWVSPHSSISGMQDVSAIVVDIAVVDPKSKILINDCLLAKLNGAPPPASCNQSQQRFLVDYNPNTMTNPGQLLASWRSVIDANTVGAPRLPVSGIRLYERFIYLSPPVL
jgi:hypothetical protein